MLGLATISFLLLLTIVYLIARPFLVPETDEGVGLAQLVETRDRAAAQLVDLDMEYSTGKLAQSDYDTRRARLQAELTQADQALDDAAAAHDDELEPVDDDELERLIAERRRELSQVACPACDALHDHDDRFCRVCGTELNEVSTR